MGIAKLDTQGRWMVDNNEIYIPSARVKIQHTNVASADSGRTEDGVMHIDWVRRDVVKVNLTYSTITGNEAAYMLNLMQGKEFQFKYYDLGQIKTINAYCGESTYEKYTETLYASEGGMYTDFQINVIEM